MPEIGKILHRWLQGDGSRSVDPAQRTDADIGYEISNTLSGMETNEQRAAYLLSISKEPSYILRASLHQQIIQRARSHINNMSVSAEKAKFQHELLGVWELVARSRLETELLTAKHELQTAHKRDLARVNKLTECRMREEAARQGFANAQQGAFDLIKWDKALSEDLRAGYAALVSAAEDFVVVTKPGEPPSERLPGLANLISAEWAGRCAIFNERTTELSSRKQTEAADQVVTHGWVDCKP